MIYCENIVNVALYFFYSSLDFRTTFISPPPPTPIFIRPLPQLLQNFFFPISAMALPQLVCQFFFSFHFGHSTHTSSRIGHKKFGIPVAEIQHFFSPPFSSSLSYFWLNFSNGNTEIQSLSSKSQISLNSSYNANKLQILQY